MIGDNLYKLGIKTLHFPFFIIDIQNYTIVLSNLAGNWNHSTDGLTQTCYKLSHGRETPCTGKNHPCPLKKVVETKNPVIVEHIHYDQEGNSGYFDIHCYPIFDNQGSVVQVIEYSIDKTQYKSMEKEQTRLINSISDAIISTDLNFIITDWNNAAENIYGWKKEEVLGKSITELTHMEYPYDEMEEVVNTFMREGIWTGEVIQKKKDGKSLNVLSSVTLLKNEAGTPITALAINRDISRRVQNETKLRQLTYDLKERVKEITCLYEISKLFGDTVLSLNKIFQSVVKLIPSAWQYPSLTCVRICYKQECFKSLNFEETYWHQSANIVIFGEEEGSVEVYYLEEMEPVKESPFLEEEQHLIEVLGREISRFIERKITKENLKTSQEKLNEVNQLFEMIFNTTDTLIAYFDSQFNFIWVNLAYANADEKNPEFFPGKNHFDLFPHEENEKIFNSVIKTGKPHYSIAKPFEYSESPERGVSYWDWSLIPIKSLNGVILGIVLSLQDVTDRMQMQEALQKSEEKYRNITELSQEIILRMGLEGGCTFINNTGADFFGRSVKDIIGENMFSFIHINDLDRTKFFIKAIKENRTPIEGFTNLMNLPNGIKAIKWNASPIFNNIGEVIEVQATGRDITELQEELIEKNRLAAVGQLAAGVAHELNTPLANIHLITEYLLSLKDKKSLIQENGILKDELLDIKNQVNLCSKIVQELLQFSRKIHLSPSKFDFKSLIQEIIHSAFFENTLSEKNIAINSMIDENIEFHGDRSLLYQVFQNILKNAIESFNELTIEKPEIQITTIKQKKHIIIKFVDNGVGIKKEDLPKVFEPFFTTKNIGEGTGLGLSISHGIIEKHKGNIRIKSKYGEGTELKIILPLR